MTQLPDYHSLDSMEGLPALESLDERKGIQARIGTIKGLAPGLLASVMAGLSAQWISEHHGGPTMLYALLFGMALNFLSEEGVCIDGIQAASRIVLRFGVALLGAGITIDEIMRLGMGPIALVAVAVPATILFGWLFSRLLGFGSVQGALSGGAVAICGASAALAISAVLPKYKELERDTILVVVGVTTLSTIAMIFYPAIVEFLGLASNQAGILFGATIHDVAQVVGAGYSISEEAGDTATFVKLLRVAMLLPAVIALSFILNRSANRAAGSGARPPVLPGFLVAFAALVAVNSLGVIPPAIATTLQDLSRWCLVTAIAAIGMKTSFRMLKVVGWRPVGVMVGESLFLLALVLVALGTGLI